MIGVLLLAAGLVFGGIGFGVYLLVRPEPPAEATDGPRPPPPAETGVTSRPPATTTTGAGPGPGTGSGSTAIDRPPDTDGDLRAVAGDYVQAVNDRDEEEARRLTCDQADPGTLFSVAEGREVTLGGVEVIEGSVASATVHVGGGETALLIERQEDGWCVAI